MVQQEMSDDMLSSSCASRLQEEAREVRRRRKKKRSGSTLVASHFLDLYKLTGEVLGRGSCGSVQVCRSIYTGEDFAVKIIEKTPDLCRAKVFKEIEMMHHCQGHNTIIQLIEYFEEEDKFFLVFEKANGGTLLSRLHKNFRLTETEASMIMRDLASALDFLHQKGIAHRDIKLENILCVYPDQVYPVKLCDFDLASDSEATGGAESASTPDLYTPVGTAEYMAPEVVRGYKFFDNDPYDKRCDLWSLGICLYFMLCGYHPFTGDCGDENCEWDLGGECEACQGLLFDNIADCSFEFPEEEWAEISDDAKNLIRQLLIEEPSERLPANMILNNPWVVSGGLSSQDSQLDDTLDSICDMPNNFDLNMTWPLMRTASRDDNWRERSSDDNQFDEFSSRADACNNWREQINVIKSHVEDQDNWREQMEVIKSHVEDRDNWREHMEVIKSHDEDRDNWRVQMEVEKSHVEHRDNWRDQMEVKKSHVDHRDNIRKNPLQSRSSVENWRERNERDHSDHESWRRTPKIDLNDRRTQQLLVYFDTRMKMYKLMKDKFKIGSIEAESFIDELYLMERFQLSPPSSRLAQRRHGRGRNRSPYQSSHLIGGNRSPYQSTHLIAAF